jgi:hypothetical protein
MGIGKARNSIFLLGFFATEFHQVARQAAQFGHAHGPVLGMAMQFLAVPPEGRPFIALEIAPVPASP